MTRGEQPSTAVLFLWVVLAALVVGTAPWWAPVVFDAVGIEWRPEVRP